MQIKYNKANTYSANGVTLLPGVNTVADADAKAFLEHPHVKIKIKRGFIQVMAEKTVRSEKPVGVQGNGNPVGNTNGQTNLDEMKAGEIVALVEKSEDKAFLESLKDHQFKTVHDAAEKRLKELEESTSE
ncbi:hypothetical protein ACFSC6_12245 [Rufibacter sediminis]|uniref:Uncharacterized protein n=1 Tax=Rufibacter sediminis TaxID=2762756 RepID=A0ABR6VV33_9BACT|nr:hypothetical protein [Rufibacter sediminis]MBC3540653.1 hypothetical protein [Rufibacter sediminis]